MRSKALVSRVNRGAALLDRVRPGWWERISLDDLAMESCDRCVLGQVYGGYHSGAASLVWRLPSTFLFSAAAHGFTLYPTEQQDMSPEVLGRFRDLADCWRDAIRARAVLCLAEARSGAT